MALIGLTNGTTVNLLGDVTFGVRSDVVSCFPATVIENADSNWAGPLFQIGTSSPTGKFIFNGRGHILDGQGARYWDNLGTNGGVTKPVVLTTCYSDKSATDVFLIAPNGPDHPRWRNFQRRGTFSLMSSSISSSQFADELSRSF